jgi:hypothetical protein
MSDTQQFALFKGAGQTSRPLFVGDKSACRAYCIDHKVSLIVRPYTPPPPPVYPREMLIVKISQLQSELVFAQLHKRPGRRALRKEIKHWQKQEWV